MYRILSDDKAESLFQVYLETIRSSGEPGRIDFPLPEKPSAAQKTPGREADYMFSPDKIFGNVRLLDDGEYLVHFLVIGQLESGLFIALKVSPFVEFQAKSDLEFVGYAGSYIAELDHSFHLNAEEIASSFILDDVDGYTLMQLESAWEARSDQLEHRFRLDRFDSWQARFHIQEHELTLSYRSREAQSGLPPSLWIPQLEFGAQISMARMSKADGPSRRKKMIADYDMALYDRMSTREEKDDRVYQRSERISSISVPLEMPEERDYRLDLGPGGAIVMLPHKRFIGRMVTIFCEEFKVFKGLLPEVLTVSEKPDRSLNQLERELRFEIRTSGN